jgi:hypothetical protein
MTAHNLKQYKGSFIHEQEDKLFARKVSYPSMSNTDFSLWDVEINLAELKTILKDTLDVAKENYKELTILIVKTLNTLDKILTNYLKTTSNDFRDNGKNKILI